MGRPFAPRQLVLALGHAESFAREDFLPGPSNAAALELIDRARVAERVLLRVIPKA